MDQYISPKKIAAAIGVSESSVKRWVDEGKLKASRTEGGHRRILVRDALDYLRTHDLPLVDPSAVGLDEAAGRLFDRVAREEDRDVFVRSVLEGEAESARSILMARYLQGESVATLCDYPLAESLRQVGLLWKHGPEGIHIEHRATEICIGALNFLGTVIPKPGAEAPLALGCSPAGDPYRIPSLMAGLVLGSVGWREMNLGSDLPVEALVKAMERHRPGLVWISFSSKSAAERFRSEHGPIPAAASALGARLVVGGGACPRSLRKGDSPYHYLPTMEALAGFARALRLA